MTKVDQTFDPVHSTQQIYRSLLDCMARPGTITTIEESVASISEQFNQALVGIALTLVDREVTFHVISHDAKEIVQFVKWNTLSDVTSIDKADYVFIDQQLEKEEIARIACQLKVGTLTDPHLSATVIVNVEKLSPSQDEGILLRLTGPGIKEHQSVSITGLSPSWLTERQSLNREYPLGVDFIFVSSSGEMMCLPRTTVIEKEGEGWDM